MTGIYNIDLVYFPIAIPIILSEVYIAISNVYTEPYKLLHPFYPVTATIICPIPCPAFRSFVWTNYIKSKIKLSKAIVIEIVMDASYMSILTIPFFICHTLECFFRRGEIQVIERKKNNQTFFLTGKDFSVGLKI